MSSKELHMPEISRALAKHNANAAYTLLRENFSQGVAGRLLLELIRTQPDWPQAQALDIEYNQLLTPRELDIVRCSERGLNELETARSFPLGLETVKTFRKRIYIKLGVSNMNAAVHKCRELGLI